MKDFRYQNENEHLMKMIQLEKMSWQKAKEYKKKY